MKLGAPLMRGLIGGLFIGHGTQKLLGWFDGPGLEGTTGMMGKLGMRPPRRFTTFPRALAPSTVSSPSRSGRPASRAPICDSC